MLQQLLNINWLSIVISFVFYFMLGGLWFTLFFPKQYKISLGKAGQDLNNRAPIFIAGPAICTLFIVLTTALLISALKIYTLNAALEFALMIGIGYLVANTVNIAINPNIPRPIHYSVITGSFHLIGIVGTCIILTVMK